MRVNSAQTDSNYQAGRRKKLRAAGLCARCGVNKSDTYECESCRDQRDRRVAVVTTSDVDWCMDCLCANAHRAECDRINHPSVSREEHHGN